MALNIPSLADVLERTRQAFKANMPGVDPYIWPSSTYVAAKVIGERVWETLHRLDYVHKQSKPITATGRDLDLHAQTYGITRSAASLAAGSAIGAGGTAGTLIPAGTPLQRSDGTQYQTLADSTLDTDGTVRVGVAALAPGASGNLAAGASLAFNAAIAGAPSQLLVSADDVVDGGSETEGDESLRARLLRRLQYPPHAGSIHDYERWAKDVPGVTRAWVGRNAFGPGSVGIWFAMDNSYEDGIPMAHDVAAVQAAIDAVAPVTANPIVMAPRPYPIRVEVVGLSPATPAVVAAVRQEIEAVISEKANVSTADRAFTFRRSWIWQAVSNASGEQYHTVQLPDEDVVIPIGAVPVFDANQISVRAE